MTLHTSMTLEQLERAMRQAAWRETAELRAENERLREEIHQLRLTRVQQGAEILRLVAQCERCVEAMREQA